MRRTSPGKRSTIVPAGKISNNILFPGQEVSVDHFVCSTKGRLWTSRGRTQDSDLYHGGALFVDQASKYIHVENQVSLSTHATIEAKMKFERMCSDIGVVVHRNTYRMEAHVSLPRNLINISVPFVKSFASPVQVLIITIQLRGRSAPSCPSHVP